MVSPNEFPEDFVDEAFSEVPPLGSCHSRGGLEQEAVQGRQLLICPMGVPGKKGVIDSCNHIIGHQFYFVHKKVCFIQDKG